MTDHLPNPDDLLGAQFRLDQEAASTEETSRDQVVWAQRVQDAVTTLAQREAVTRRVIAQAALLEGLNVALWLLFTLGALAALVFGAITAGRAVL